MSRQKTLYRDPTNGKVRGVCAGIADYMDMDPMLVRSIFVLAAIFMFLVTVILYFVFSAILPTKPVDAPVTQVRIPKESISQQLDELEVAVGNIEEMLNRMESYVTSDEFEFQRKLRDL